MWSRSATQLSPAAPQSGGWGCKSGCFPSLRFGVVCHGAVDNWTVSIHIFRRFEPNFWRKLAKANLKSPTSLHPCCTEPSTILTGSETGPACCLLVGAYGGLDVSGVGPGTEGLGKFNWRRGGLLQMNEQSPLGPGPLLHRRLNTGSSFFLVSLHRRGPDAKTGWARMAKFPFFFALRANFSYMI